MSYDSGEIVPVVSNHPRAMRSADLKSLVRLLPEFYSTQSYYHYLSINHKKYIDLAKPKSGAPHKFLFRVINSAPANL